MEELPSIPQFFADKCVFITGGSGFLGKVLVEKLLRSCPDIKRIYLLLRPKKGLGLEERLQQITDTALFDLLKSQQPLAVSKIKPINGDASKLGLGLSPQDRQLLVDEVSVVFHAAASVRFDDPIKHAILLNTRGTREVCQLALEMPHLQVFVHVSTTYCNTSRKVVDEVLYPAPADWRKCIEIAENADEEVLEVMTPKLIQPLVNTYCFAKALAEHVVDDMCSGKIPTVVFRPSIVISTAYEPVQGWVDNFNGPMGLMLGGGKGVLRTTYCDVSKTSDYVPVDIIIKGIIISAWKQATLKDQDQKLKTFFYNGSNNDVNPITLGRMIDMGFEVCHDIPLNDVLWYPGNTPTKCYYHYFLNVILYHLIPAIFLDTILKIAGKKPMLLKIQRKIFVANMALKYFTHNQWTFINTNTFDLRNQILPNDQEQFSFRENELSHRDFLRNAIIGTRRYFLKEGDETMENAKRHMTRMWVLAKICSILWYTLLLWFLFCKVDVLGLVGRKLQNVQLYFTTN